MSDLRANDFGVTVDGTPRTIVTADFTSYPVAANAAVRASSQPAPVAPEFTSNEVARTPGRTVVLVVDEENIRAGYGKWAAGAAVAFVDRLQPNDRVGLIVPRSQLHMAPTSDRAAVKEALGHLVGHMPHIQTGLAAACDAAIGRKKDPGDPGSGGSGGGSSAGDPSQWASVGEMHDRSVRTLRSLVTLLESLTADSGSRTVVLVAEEMPICDNFVAQVEFKQEFARLAAAAAGARAMLYVLQLDRPIVDPEDPQRASANSNDLTPWRDAEIRSLGLESAVSVTGGKRLLVSGRPEGPLERVSLEISGQYLLGIRTEPADRDGRAHNIKVTVRRQGVEVRARQMFTYAPDAVVADKSASDAVNRVLRAATAESGIPMAVATYSAIEPGNGAPQMRVTITAEIDRGAAKEMPLTVGYTITDSTGRNAGASVEGVTLRPAIGHPDGPLVYVAGAVVPPGSYALRLAAADGSLRVGSVVHQFEARPIPAGPVTLGDLVVFDRYAAEAGKGRPSVSATVATVLSGYLVAYSAQPGSVPPADLAARLEIADSIDAPAHASGHMTIEGPDASGRLLIGGTVDAMGLPSGHYVARAVLLAAGKILGRATRPIRVLSQATAPAAAPVATAAPSPTGRAAATQPGAPVHTEANPGAHDTRGAAAILLNEVLQRVSNYVAAYGAQAASFVGTESYDQRLDGWTEPRRLLSEFAIVNAGAGNNWLGYRDVVRVDGKLVADRQDRLLRLLSSSSIDAEQLRRINDESARYNIGPINRNFNVPTAVMFFLDPATIGRFSFERKGTKTIDGVVTWELEFKETHRPTLVRTPAGRDVPSNGRIWVRPADGTVVRTRVELRGFVDIPGVGTMATGGVTTPDRPLSRGNTTGGSVRRMDSLAEIEVSYHLDARFGVWLPSKMSELYEGAVAVPGALRPRQVRSTGVAEYSNFRRFETSGRIVTPK